MIDLQSIQIARINGGRESIETCECEMSFYGNDIDVDITVNGINESEKEKILNRPDIKLFINLFSGFYIMSIDISGVIGGSSVMLCSKKRRKEQQAGAQLLENIQCTVFVADELTGEILLEKSIQTSRRFYEAVQKAENSIANDNIRPQDAARKANDIIGHYSHKKLIKNAYAIYKSGSFS